MIMPDPKQFFSRDGRGPNKLLGQSFLVDQGTLQNIIKAAALRPDDTVFEIGPGLGVLTFAIAAVAERVIAVEKDEKLATILQEEILRRKITNIELIAADVLKLPQDIFARISPYRVVANIPYYLTARLIRKLLENENPPTDIILTVQKEVAERIVAKPPHMNLLALAVQVYGAPKILFPISKKSFWPEPKVNSACILIENISSELFLKEKVDSKKFFHMLRACFQGKRKMLQNTLAGFLALPKGEAYKFLEKAGIRPSARPEELSLTQWIRLARLVASASYP